MVDFGQGLINNDSLFIPCLGRVPYYVITLCKVHSSGYFCFGDVSMHYVNVSVLIKFAKYTR